MAKNGKPDSQAVGNTDDATRGRSKGGSHVKPRINSEKTLEQIKREGGKK
jgi:hypothetical protein